MPEPAMLAHLGVSESGKTYALQRCVREEVAAGDRRFLVLDLYGEWPGVCRVHHYGAARDVAEARAALEHERLVVVQPVDESGEIYDPETTDRDEIYNLGQSLAHLAFKRGCIFVVPEAQLFMPEGTRLSGPWLKLATGWRHGRLGCGLWMDTQRPALVSKTALGQCRRWRVFALMFEDRENWARKLGGASLTEAVDQCSAMLDEDGPNEPGWCVEMSPRSRPPFTAKRFAR